MLKTQKSDLRGQHLLWLSFISHIIFGHLICQPLLEMKKIAVIRHLQQKFNPINLDQIST